MNGKKLESSFHCADSKLSKEISVFSFQRFGFRTLLYILSCERITLICFDKLLIKRVK